MVSVHPLRKNYFQWLPLLIWMSIIFFLSHQPAEESKALSDWMVYLLNIFQLEVETLERWNIPFLIRKLAHFTVYGIMFLFAYVACMGAATRRRQVTTAFMITLLYAISDEFHQTFIPGRVGHYSDVLVDISGAIGAYWVLQFFRSRLG
ncbi:MAG: VanZ family protein [Bacteroidota bacterium]